VILAAAILLLSARWRLAPASPGPLARAGAQQRDISVAIA
jgi:hypothetical protein